MLLLMALALLQTRIAFAACLGGAAQASGAACCEVPGSMLDASDAPLARLCADHCVRPFAPHEPDQKVFVPPGKTLAWVADRFVVHPTAVPKAAPRQFLAELRVEGRHLLYRLQRLLI